MAKKKKKGQRADGLVEIKRKMADGSYKHFYGSSKADCEAKYREALVAAAQKEEVSALFKNVAADWWDDYQRSVKPGTHRAYKASYHRLLEEYGELPMQQITPEHVQRLILKMSRMGLAGSTVANTRSILSLIFKFWCVRDGQTYNPVQVVSLPRGLKKEERQPPTPHELEIVRAHPEGFGLCAWLFMYTGCRLGEVAALQWQDIDFEQNKIHIVKSASWGSDGKPVITTPKTKNSIRDVPLLEALRPVLQERRGAPAEYVISGKEPLTRNQYTRAWLRYCQEIGLVEIDPVAEAARERKRAVAYGGERKRAVTTHKYRATVTAHQFRHEMASSLYEAGVGELEAQRILGHADIATTHKIYTHVRDAQLDAAASKLDDYFKKVVEKS